MRAREELAAAHAPRRPAGNDGLLRHPASARLDPDDQPLSECRSALRLPARALLDQPLHLLRQCVVVAAFMLLGVS